MKWSNNAKNTLSGKTMDLQGKGKKWIIMAEAAGRGGSF